MVETFGHKWTSSYGLDPSPAWKDGMADLTIDEVRRGLSALKNWREEWPPTMPQFRDLCRPMSTAAHTDYVPLPQPASSWDVRQDAATAACNSLREGILKPEVAGRDYRLSDEDRANMARLDWERIHPAPGQGITQEPRRPLVKLDAPMSSSTGCTCRMTFNGEGYVVRRHTCDYCLAWDRKLTEAGVSVTPKPVEEKKSGKRRYRRAA
jgi:hypothetical protein